MPNTTPAADAGATKASAPGKRAATPAAQETPAAPAVTDATAVVAETAPAPPEPEPGWFRNTAATPLTVLPDRYPSARLEPGQAAWLPDDPRHPNLERCDAPDPDANAADTAGSEK